MESIKERLKKRKASKKEREAKGELTKGQKGVLKNGKLVLNICSGVTTSACALGLSGMIAHGIMAMNGTDPNYMHFHEATMLTDTAALAGLLVSGGFHAFKKYSKKHIEDQTQRYIDAFEKGDIAQQSFFDENLDDCGINAQLGGMEKSPITNKITGKVNRGSRAKFNKYVAKKQREYTDALLCCDNEKATEIKDKMGENLYLKTSFREL